MRVLRLGDGALLTLFDGRGGEYGARISGLNKHSVKVDVLEHRAVERESALHLTLAQGISRGERMDWVMQKATELGVSRIIPVITERTMVKLDERQSEKKVQHWRGIVVAACEQSGRAVVPAVWAPAALATALAALPAGGLRLILDPFGALSLSTLEPPGGQSILLAVGPEGGWSPRDRDELVAAGFDGMRLGPRVLRTETAGLAAIAALQARFGDLA